MKEEDLPFVLKIEKISYPNPWSETTFKGEINNHPISSPLVVVHKLQNKIIGYVIFWSVNDEVQVSNIAIHPEFRRQGIAEGVLQHVLHQVHKEGIRFVTLEVRPSNFAALSLYNKLKFKLLGIRKDYYHNPREHAFVMGKQLHQ